LFAPFCAFKSGTHKRPKSTHPAPSKTLSPMGFQNGQDFEEENPAAMIFST
jgi:hypothetical protein